VVESKWAMVAFCLGSGLRLVMGAGGRRAHEVTVGSSRCVMWVRICNFVQTVGGCVVLWRSSKLSLCRKQLEAGGWRCPCSSPDWPPLYWHLPSPSIYLRYYTFTQSLFRSLQGCLKAVLWRLALCIPSSVPSQFFGFSSVCEHHRLATRWG